MQDVSGTCVRCTCVCKSKTSWLSCSKTLINFCTLLYLAPGTHVKCSCVLPQTTLNDIHSCMSGNAYNDWSSFPNRVLDVGKVYVDASYGTAQLQGNVRTRPRRVLHAFQTCPTCIPDTPCTRSGHVPCLAKMAWHSCMSCCSFIARFCACTDISCTFQKHANVSLVLSCTVPRF